MHDLILIAIITAIFWLALRALMLSNEKNKIELDELKRLENDDAKR